jgi:hypothetical protein
VPEIPSRDGTVTAAACPICAAPLPPGRPRRWCSPRCRQTAYRRRNAPAPTAVAAPPNPMPATATGVYECPGCGERLAGQSRCPDCNLYARRLGTGGHCPACGDIVTIEELLEDAIN